VDPLTDAPPEQLAGGKLTPPLPATLPFSQGLGTIAF
jgi:hypothetical protein